MKKLITLVVLTAITGTAQSRLFMDKNRDGIVSLEEYLAAIKISKERRGEVYNEEAAKKFFVQLDLNGDGVLSGDEL